MWWSRLSSSRGKVLRVGALIAIMPLITNPNPHDSEDSEGEGEADECAGTLSEAQILKLMV